MAAAIALMLYRQMPRVAFESERDKEQLLIDRGAQYQRAIQVYFVTFKRYPSRIEDLENTNDHRFLRRRYIDPYTGKNEWRLIHTNGMTLTDSKVQPPPNPATGTAPARGTGTRQWRRERCDFDLDLDSTTSNTSSTGAGGPGCPACRECHRGRPAERPHATRQLNRIPTRHRLPAYNQAAQIMLRIILRITTTRPNFRPSVCSPTATMRPPRPGQPGQPGNGLQTNPNQPGLISLV